MRFVLLLLLLPLLGCGEKAEPELYLPPTQTGDAIALAGQGNHQWPGCRMPRYPWVC